jgi:hypothetical protein
MKKEERKTSLKRNSHKEVKYISLNNIGGMEVYTCTPICNRVGKISYGRRSIGISAR